ncbi:hypothetical protein [Vibrio harveyi]|uniref:hypothetical protein n=1 Tax=Vibrio harveyi TaxID=669 RepID=UPI0018F27908|nr:hypothetical protein [Vibrio harveyi]MCQ9076759.1 hypothetical protein [Vibrio harveyi]
MVTISPELGFPVGINADLKKSFEFVHSDGSELDLIEFRYIAVDVKKYDLWWKEKLHDSYIPHNLDEINDSPFLMEPTEQYLKSARKTSKLRVAYEDGQQFKLKCPVFSENDPSFQQGQHRFWLIRYLELPFFIAAASERVFNMIVELEIEFPLEKRSRYRFDRYFNIIHDYEPNSVP